MIYMLLRHLEYSWRETDEILDTIGSMKCKTAHKWADLYLNGDFEEFIGENHGGQRTVFFLTSLLNWSWKQGHLPSRSVPRKLAALPSNR